MKLAWEILAFLYRVQPVHPVYWIRRAATDWREIRYYLGLLWPWSPTGQTRLYRCQGCGRLCHSYVTPGSITAEWDAEGAAQLVGRCAKCEREEVEA